ncbi:MAG: RNA polymerase sigma factor, partial [Gemmataceae bacterium]|nr:RNA polymerase sigma factor [Gemmataceae bacterium]
AAHEPAAPDAPPDDPGELRRVLDEELAKLPDKYRAAVVLCELEGLSRAAAAAQMGIPEGTLSSRLAHARKVLAERLTRRGVTASATALTTLLAREAVATSVPHTLSRTTSSLAARFAPGGAVPAGASPAVVSLTDGVLKTMLLSRLRQTLAAGLLACGLIGVGGALAQQLGRPAVAPDQPAQVRPATPVDPIDPDAPVAQPKAAEPKKVAAKGIEDEDVPYAAFPAQAVVRVEDGKLIVRQRVVEYKQVRGNTFGDARTPARDVVTTARVSTVTAATHDTADIAVFDMKGNRLMPKAWKELLKADAHVLIAYDGKLPNPRELTLFKQDALLVVLPASAAPAVASVYSAPLVEAVPPSSFVPAPVQPPNVVRPAVPPRPPTPRSFLPGEGEEGRSFTPQEIPTVPGGSGRVVH